jgi:hypothetical protein
MQNIIKLIFTFLVAGAFVSCERNVSEITFEGGTAPVLSANKTAIDLKFATANEEAITLMWTNPNYAFSTGNSSHNVSYTLEIDTVGANFSNPKKKTLVISSNLEQKITQAELNDYLLSSLELLPSMPHNIQMRVTSSIGSGSSGLLTSNTLGYTVTPYSIPPKVNPPATGELFITGGATPGGWQCACGEAPLVAQKFTQVSPTLYELNRITLTGGQSFLFLPVYGSWAAKYGFTGNGNENNVDGDEFREGGNDLKAPATGDYKIVVNFQTGRYSLTRL